MDFQTLFRLSWDLMKNKSKHPLVHKHFLEYIAKYVAVVDIENVNTFNDGNSTNPHSLIWIMNGIFNQSCIHALPKHVRLRSSFMKAIKTLFSGKHLQKQNQDISNMVCAIFWKCFDAFTANNPTAGDQTLPEILTRGKTYASQKKGLWTKTLKIPSELGSIYKDCEVGASLDEAFLSQFQPVSVGNRNAISSSSRTSDVLINEQSTIPETLTPVSTASTNSNNNNNNNEDGGGSIDNLNGADTLDNALGSLTHVDKIKLKRQALLKVAETHGEYCLKLEKEKSDYSNKRQNALNEAEELDVEIQKQENRIKVRKIHEAIGHDFMEFFRNVINTKYVGSGGGLGFYNDAKVKMEEIYNVPGGSSHPPLSIDHILNNNGQQLEESPSVTMVDDEVDPITLLANITGSNSSTNSNNGSVQTD